MSFGTNSVMFAGFGGQGILFSAKVIATAGLLDGKEVTWLPSYGPEMRGGTANCSVILSDEPVSSPIIVAPDVLVAMNLPSYDKFEKQVAPGGKVFLDSTLISRQPERSDIETFYIPATRMAGDEGIPALANMIIIGKVIRECGIIDYDNIPPLLEKIVSARKPALIEMNMKAIQLGFNL